MYVVNIKIGEGKRVRTSDPQVKSLLLYQLSYTPKIMVEPLGIEPSFSVLQTDVSTSFTKVPLKMVGRDGFEPPMSEDG